MTQEKPQTALSVICNGLDSMGAGFADALKGTNISTDRFIEAAKITIQTHPQLDKLERADRKSLYLAVKQLAADGLIPDGREAALVVYKDKVQALPMVQGLVKLARNSGEIDKIDAEVVFENDEFEFYHDFNGVVFKHKADWKTDERGKPLLVWAKVTLKSGEIILRAYPKKRIDQIATRSHLSGNYNPSTGKDWEEFWRKAAIRNILKYAPKSTAIDKAMAAMDAEFEPTEPTQQETPETQPAATRTRASRVVTPEPEPAKHDDQGAQIIDGSFTEEQSDDEKLPI